MTPKEEAKQIVEKFSEVFLPIGIEGKQALIKECAIIHVKGLIGVLKEVSYMTNTSLEQSYYQEVKKEIQSI